MQVLIVDDEPAVLRSIVTLTKSLKPEWKLDSCLNALEAQKMLNSKFYDLLLTDINLPILSGLDLAKWVKQQELNTRIIIISGYSDFDYARSAMLLGINHYILKPLEEEPYLILLNKIETEYVQQNERYRKDLLKQTLVSMPLGKAPFSADIRKHSEQISFRDSHFLLLIACYGCKVQDWQEAEEQKLSYIQKMALERLVKSILWKNEDCWQFESLYGTVTLIVTLPQTNAFSRCNEVLEYLKDWVKTNSPLTIISAGISKISSDLTRHQKQILNNLTRFASLSGGALIEYDHSTPKLSSEITVEFRKQYRFFWESQVNSKYSDIQIRWNSIVSQWKNVLLKQEHCEMEIDYFCHAAEFCPIPELSTPALRILCPSLKGVLSTATGWDDFLVESEKSLTEFFEDFGKTQTLAMDKHARTVSELKLFLDENYKYNFSNKELSMRFGYSPSYLSNLFRVQFGVSPLDYLNGLRIKEAKHMLSNDMEITASEISSQLGFTDASYFSKVFKKFVGVAPSLYRQKLIDSKFD